MRTVEGAPRNQVRDGLVHPLAAFDLFGDGRDRLEQVETYVETVGTIVLQEECSPAVPRGVAGHEAQVPRVDDLIDRLRPRRVTTLVLVGRGVHVFEQPIGVRPLARVRRLREVEPVGKEAREDPIRTIEVRRKLEAPWAYLVDGDAKALPLKPFIACIECASCNAAELRMARTLQFTSGMRPRCRRRVTNSCLRDAIG